MSVTRLSASAKLDYHIQACHAGCKYGLTSSIEAGTKKAVQKPRGDEAIGKSLLLVLPASL